MAIRTPTLEYNTVGNAYARKENVQQYGIQTRQQAQNIEAINDDRDYRRTKRQLGLVKQVANFVTTVGPAIEGVVQASQLEDAKSDVLEIQTENLKNIYQSLANGSTYMGPDGEFVIDQGYQSWQQDQLSAIDNSNDMKSVKQWKRAALLQTFENGQGILLDEAYKNYSKAYNESFSNNLETSKQLDISNGTLDHGFATISGRVDWSPSQKQAAFETYQIEVKKGYDTQSISDIAAAKGIAAATTEAYKLKGYTPQEIQSIVATAANTDQQLSNAAASTVSSVMSAGLEAGRNASDLWRDIDAAVEKMPEDRKKLALDVAKAVQIDYVTGKATQMWVGDADADLGFLKERRDSIQDGPLAAQLFYNIPEIQDNFVTLYDKQIAAVQKVQKAESDEMVKINKTSATSIYRQFEQGTISGHEAIASLMAIGENTASMDDDVYAMDFLTKVKDSAIPARFKPTADSFMKQMNSINWGIGAERDKFTPEQEGELATAQQWAYGMIADLFLSTAGDKITDSQFTEALSTINRIYTSDVLDVLGKASITEKRATSDMINLGYTMSADKTVYFDDAKGQIQWASKSVKEAFTTVSGQFSNELKNYGVTVRTAPHPLVIGNEVFPIPQFIGTEADGISRIYTFDRADVFSSEDGGNTWQKRWTLEDSKIDKTKLSSGELKNDKTQLNEYFDMYRADTAEEPPAPVEPRGELGIDAVSGAAPKVKKTDTTPAEDAAKIDRHNAARQLKPEVKEQAKEIPIAPDKTPEKPPKPSPTNTKAEPPAPNESAPQWAQDTKEKYADAAVPKEDRKAVEQDKTILSKLDGQRQTMLKNKLRVWMLNNPDKEQAKEIPIAPDKTPEKPPKPSPTNTKAEPPAPNESAPQWAQDTKEKYADAAVPKEDRKAVEQDKTILSKLDGQRQTMLKNKLRVWMLNNPDKEQAKEIPIAPDKTPEKPPKPSPTNTKAEPPAPNESAPQWAQDTKEKYADAAVPKEDRKAVEQDKTILSKLDGQRQTMLKNKLRVWMLNNPDKEPGKADLPKELFFVTDDMVKAMYRTIVRERNTK